MKPYYLKNAGEYHSRLTTKLAVLLLALPAVGAFAGDAVEYTDITGVSGATQIVTSATGATGAVLVADVIAPASNPSDGLTTTVLQATNLPTYYYLTSGTFFASATGTSVATVNFGTVKAMSLTLKNGVSLSLGADSNSTLNLGYYTKTMGANGYYISDVSDGNSITVQGAVVNSNDLARSQMVAAGSFNLGAASKNNSVNVKDGGALYIGQNLVIGTATADKGNASLGGGNSLTVTGSSSATFAAGIKKAYSFVDVGGDIIIGNYSGNNTVTVSASGVLGAESSIAEWPSASADATQIVVGANSTGNKLSIDGGSAYTTGSTAVGVSAGSNTLEVKGGGSLSTNGVILGNYGSSNTATVSSATVDSSDFIFVGAGEYNTGEKYKADGTEGFDAAKGNSNTFTATGAKIKVSAISDKAIDAIDGYSLIVGGNGSNNSMTLSGGTFIASAWTDADYDGLCIVSAGISNVVVGLGVAPDGNYDVSGAGDANTLTVSGSYLLSSGTITVGSFGSSNKLVLSDGAVIASTLNQEDGNKVSGTAALSIGVGSSDVLSANDDTKFANANSVKIAGSTAHLSAVVVGAYGSNNSLEISGGAKVDATTLTSGSNAAAGSSGGILVSTIKAARNNSVLVDGKDTLFIASGNAIIGDNGVSNTLTIQNQANVWFKTVLGIGKNSSNISGKCGNSNKVVVSGAGSVLKVNNGIAIGSTDNSSSFNELDVSSDAVVVIDTNYNLAGAMEAPIEINTYGDGNCIKLDGGFIAIKGKLGVDDHDKYIDTLYEGLFGSEEVNGTVTTHLNGIIDNGGLKVMKNGSFKTATASDISAVYYDNDAEAAAATGYEGLAGYTIISQGTGSSTRDLSWAGSNLFDNKDGWYCSTWYGWFYSTEASGNFIMSSTADSWQYVDPSSTSTAAYFYDYKLGSWIYTDSTHFQKGWVYEYKTSSWIQLGK
jgi:hypothetical protein